MISIVGMGTNKGDLTQSGKKAIKNADIVVARTFLLPSLAFLKSKGAVSMDALYESAADFDELNLSIANKLTELAVDGKNVVYCVDGDGYSDGAAVILMQKNSANLIQGVSDMGSRVAHEGGIFICDAYSIIKYKPFLDTGSALSISAIDNALIAGEVKLFLLEYYGSETRVFYRGKTASTSFLLYELDMQRKYDSTSSIFIPPQAGYNKDKYCFADLIRILVRLTGKDGCEWDKIQTHQSIRINMIEEAYEAVDAIDSGDVAAMIEEMGDVLLQSVLHADIAARSGEFNIFDVVDTLCKKLVSRHTHIFGENKATTSSEALAFWENAKSKEKSQNTLIDKLSSIVEGFPALLKTQKAVKKMQKEGLVVDKATLTEQLIGAASGGDIARALLFCAALASIYELDGEVELNRLCNLIILRAKEGGVENKPLNELL